MRVPTAIPELCVTLNYVGPDPELCVTLNYVGPIDA
jgi:hypothetical protein